ncbi:hypothetical protein HK099_005520 [Clydaea vesicula]|uniref:Uncharacterized protein n=1 Tax=Clydaea vesicula TaxID=447962 RepID=A0AAD5XUX3_9FUNG|nr:hypothetical protein HK099_005520 [Clydaea vesicula]
MNVSYSAYSGIPLGFFVYDLKGKKLILPNCFSYKKEANTNFYFSTQTMKKLIIGTGYLVFWNYFENENKIAGKKCNNQKYNYTDDLVKGDDSLRNEARGSAAVGERLKLLLKQNQTEKGVAVYEILENFFGVLIAFMLKRLKKKKSNLGK